MKKLLVLMVGFAIWGTALPYTWNVTNFTNVAYNVEVYEIGKVIGSANPKMTVPSSASNSVNTVGYLSNGFCVTDINGNEVFKKTWSKLLGRGGENLILVKDAKGALHVIQGNVLESSK